jgi:hypothetical protein
LRATFTDVLVGEVELTVKALGLVENEYVSDWLFNIDEDFEDSVDSLMFTPLPGPLASLGLTANTYSGGGSNSFDIALGFPTAEASRFGAGDSFTFSITSDEISVEAALFDVLNNYPKGPYFETIAYIQGIGPDGSSGWIAQGSGTTPVPEPTTMLFFGLGLIGLVGLGRNRLKK